MTNEQPSHDQITDILTQVHSSDLLTAFIHAYNQEQADNEEQQTIHELYKQNTADEIQILKSQLEAEKRLVASQQESLAQQTEDLNKAAKAIEDAQTLAKTTTAQLNQITTLKQQLEAAQQAVRELKQLNPLKLKEQIKRTKEANAKAQARNKKLELEAKEYRKTIAHHEQRYNECINKIRQQKAELEHNTGAGLYHKGKDHLIIWPQKTKMERPDGSIFESRSLLYLHQSGRGGLVTFDPETGAQLCAAPKGGLRMADETIEYAKDWLFTVNELQDGVVHDKDMIPVNHNL